MALRIKVRDLTPLHSRKVSGDRPELRSLTDAELLAACERPARGDPLKINTKTGKLIDGNGRAYELRRRAARPDSTITDETEVRCKEHTPDDSMFPDLE